MTVPSLWTEAVKRPQTPEEWEAVRRSVLRGFPYGSEPWQKQMAVAVRLQSLLRPRGRLRQTEDDAGEMK
jgi:putative transposase